MNAIPPAPEFANSHFRSREITPHQLSRAKPLPLIIDIRNEHEFRSGHIDGAKHLGRAGLQHRLGIIAPESSTPIVVYCAKGDEGPFVADELTRMGYGAVSALKGGLRSWLEAGGMVECNWSDLPSQEVCSLSRATSRLAARSEQRF